MADTTYNFVNIEQAGQEYLDTLLDGQQEMYYTGLKSIDQSVRGLTRGELCVVAGRPSHGKTMLGLQWLYNVAASSVNCLLVSEEMGIEAIAKRAVQYAVDIHEDAWKNKYDQVYESFAQFWQHRSNVKVVTSLGHVENVVGAIEQAVEYSNVEFVVIDYLQLLRGSGSSGYEQVTNISKELKRVTVEKSIATVALAQLSRAAETEKDQAPRLRHLKESGQIEQDADQVLLVQWPHRINPDHTYSEYRVYCAKNRNRGIRESIVTLKFVPSRQQLMECTLQEQAEQHDNFQPTFKEWNER